MKQTFIGTTFLICGTVIDSVIIIVASIYCTALTSWCGSKLWYTIFGATTYGNEVNLSLNLGAPFIFGTIMLLGGTAILLMELLKPVCKKGI